MYNLLVESPILHKSRESQCTPIPGNHWVLHQACLLNEANSSLPLEKSTMLSISHTAKVTDLAFQTSPIDYVYMSPPAYMPMENNVPVISCQK